MLEKYGVPLYKEQMVEHLLDPIMSPNTELKTEVNICRSSHWSTFFKASTYLSTVVTRLYPSVNSSSVCFRERSIYASGHGYRGGGRGGRFYGRGRVIGRGGRVVQGRGVNVQVGRGGGSGAPENGIYISDVTRYLRRFIVGCTLKQ